jgi:hypothetical protein
LGINLSLRVIELPEKKGSYSAVFERGEGKIYVLNIQFAGEIALEKIFQSEA